MEIISLLIPVAIVLVIIITAAFFWAVRKGQFEDLERQGRAMLLDDEDD